MITLGFVQLGLQTVLEVLKAWNALKPEHRDIIVATWIADDIKRREWWGRFTGWWERQFTQPPAIPPKVG